MMSALLLNSRNRENTSRDSPVEANSKSSLALYALCQRQYIGCNAVLSCALRDRMNGSFNTAKRVRPIGFEKMQDSHVSPVQMCAFRTHPSIFSGSKNNF
jgi:hypothetical protein